MRVLLQFPEGLKQEALKYAKIYEEKGIEIIISASPSFGACDLAIDEAKRVNADKLIHFGHLPFLKQPVVEGIEVEYIPYYLDARADVPAKIMGKVKERGYKKISLGTTAQHMHQFKEWVKSIESEGIEVVYKKGNFTFEAGQILGCDAEAVNVESDAVFIVADGLFHLTALSLIDMDRDIYWVHPYNGEIKNGKEIIEQTKTMRKRSLTSAFYGKTFAILVSTKPGQYRLEWARKLKERLERLGKKAHILVANTFNPESLTNFNAFDIYINTACPRLSEDKELFNKPIISEPELSLFLKMLEENQNRE